jgi:hypothetical protein
LTHSLTSYGLRIAVGHGCQGQDSRVNYNSYEPIVSKPSYALQAICSYALQKICKKFASFLQEICKTLLSLPSIFLSCYS